MDGNSHYYKLFNGGVIKFAIDSTQNQNLLIEYLKKCEI